MKRLCACRCGTPLDAATRRERGLTPLRVDAKWATRACTMRWTRANPGKSLHDARAVVIGRTKPARSSGTSVRVGYRPALASTAALLTQRLDLAEQEARALAHEALHPLLSPRLQEVVARDHQSPS